MKQFTLSAAVALACLSSSGGAFAADPMSYKHSASRIGAQLEAMADSVAKPGSKSPSAARIQGQSSAAGGTNPDFQPLPVQMVGDDKIVIDVIASGDPQVLLAELEALGMTKTSVFGSVISGAMPLAALGQLSGLSGLASASPTMVQPQAGLVTSRGDIVMNSDAVKGIFGITGSGVKVGTLSDSYDCTGLGGGAAADVANDDLPTGIEVLSDLPGGCIDEGRAMMQIIHDVSPGADQAFHTAFNGLADFANGIIRLQEEAGADVIVDDIIYFAEPMFADGIIAQAAQQVADNGSSYFSSAGNNGADSYESPFRSSGITGVFGGERHDFDPGPEVDDLQSFALFPGSNIIVLQWDQPYRSTSEESPGSASDVDGIIYFNGFPQFGFSGISGNIGGNPVEVFGINLGGDAPVVIELGIELFEGAAPNVIKYVHFGGLQLEQAVASSTSYGHANAANVAGVGASAWFNTATFSEFCQPACLNGFSSLGGVPILFDTLGDRIFDVRQQPRFVAPDGTNTTFFGFALGLPGTDEPDGFPNFFGTSAAAPHAAAVAALMLQTNPSLEPGEIYSILQETASDMTEGPNEGTGFDFASGFGFINAEAAVDAAATDPRNSRKRFVCHKPGKKEKTLSIGQPAVRAHLAHGDKFGPCK